MWDSLVDGLNDAVVDTFEVLATVGQEDIRGTFTEYHNDIDLTEVGVSGRQPVFMCKAVDAQSVGLVYKSELTIKSTDYVVVEVMPDKMGWIEFKLEEVD